MNRKPLAAAFLLPATLLWGCSDRQLAGPPDLRLGRDECAECGMLISEDRCSSAMLIEADGARSHVLFDDIGCMLDYERTRSADFTALSRYVRDHAARSWADADAATFLFADRDRLPTPMGTGIVAFADRANAESLQRTHGGEMTDLAGAAAKRATYAASRARAAEPAP